MTSTRPYLIRALYDWIEDNSMTPYLLVDAEQPGVSVPRQHVREGKITFNINQAAVHNLQLGNEWIEFSARFGGVARNVEIPVVAVMAIYAHENGHGMAFSKEDTGDNEPTPGAPQPDDPPVKPTPHKPTLKVVK